MAEMEVDTRLSKTKSEYRMLYDASDVLVPEGQSTTQPLDKEIVGLNTRIYGEIDNGYFNMPVVDFVNTDVKTERFDQFYLQTWRKPENMPTEETPDVTLNDTLGIKAIQVDTDVQFNLHIDDLNEYGVTIRARSDAEGLVNFYHQVPTGTGSTSERWITPLLHFDGQSNQHLEGDFFFYAANSNLDPSNAWSFDTGKTLQVDNLKVFIVITHMNVVLGNSSMKVIDWNAPFSPTLVGSAPTFLVNKFNVIGGE
jgi:hypothetical protein